MVAPYVPLRIFSCYTMLEGAIEPKAIARQAKRLDFPAAALTDRNGLYAAMPFTDACIEAGVQPIIGTLLGVARPGTAEGKPSLIDWLPLYAQDETGYRESLRAGFRGASRPAGRGGAACPVRVARRPHRRPDRADRRRRGGARPAGRRGPAVRALCPAPSGPVSRPALRRAQPPRRPGRAGGRERPHRPRLRARPAVGRDQPCLLCRRQLPPRPRRHALHRPVEPDRARRSRDLLARSLDQARRRHARLVRRPARGDRQHVGHRPPLRVRRAEAKADPAAHRRRSRRRGRPAPRRRPGRPGAAARRSIPTSARPSAKPISTGSTSRSTSSSAWAFPAIS